MSNDLQIVLNELLRLKKHMEIFIPDLTIEKEVIHFFNIDRRTFKKYIEEGRLEEGIHYFNDNNKRIYVPDAIIAFKKSGCRLPVTNPKSQAVLKRFGL